MIQLLVQFPDEETLTRLLDAHELHEVAEQTECFFFVITDGRVTEFHPKQPTTGGSP